MHVLFRLTTGLLFAAHAALGCGAHRSCEHSTTIACEAEVHADHHCTAGHEDPCLPGDERGDHAPVCDHSDCSFVKADVQQVDAGMNALDLAVPSATTDSVASAQQAALMGRPLCLADHSSTHLYVWHCALIL